VRDISDIRKLDATLAGRRALVLFHATWCSHCRAFKPVFNESAPALHGHDVFEVVLDDDDNPLWDKYGIEVVPTVIFFDGGKVAQRLDARRGVGLEAADLKRALDGAGAPRQAPSKTKNARKRPGKR
jgi:thioredoxin 1